MYSMQGDNVSPEGSCSGLARRSAVSMVPSEYFFL